MLIDHAKKNVPYFKDKLEEVNDIEDIAKIPLMTKNIIIANKTEIKATNFPEERFIEDSTSGSTGKSLFYYRDRQNYSRVASPYLDDHRAGYKIGAKVLYLWGADRDIADKSLYQRIKDKYIHKVKMLSSYHMSNDDLEQYVQDYNKYKPAAIIAYASSLFALACYIEKNKIKIWKPKGIITSAETLFPFQREKIEQVFKTKVYNRYGSREFGHIAAECEEHNGLHIHSNRLVLEIVNEKGKLCKTGELGEIVLTDLDEYAFPMIRYKTGDLGVLSDRKCECGRGFQLLERIEGRVFDLIEGENGNRVGGTFWTLLKHKIEGWSKFQVVQKAVDKLEIIVERDDAMKANFEEKLSEIIRDKLGQKMQIKINVVDTIPKTKTGKHRWIISEISKYAN